MNFVALANDLEAVAFLADELFLHDAVDDPAGHFECLKLPAAAAQDRAFEIRRIDDGRHPVQPVVG